MAADQLVVAGAASEAMDPDLALRPVETTALHQRVYLSLRHAIRRGRFLPGEVVTIQGLARLLGTSTMPVREAIRRLVVEQALEALPNRTVRLVPMSRQRFDGVTEVRVLLEGQAAANAAQRAGAEDIAAIERANDLMRAALAAGDHSAVIAANERFHFAIYEAARAPVLFGIIDGLWLQSGPYLRNLYRSLQSDPRDMLDVGVNHHNAIIAALKARDDAAARRMLARDIEDAADWYRRNGTFDA